MTEDFNLLDYAGTVTSNTPTYGALNKETRAEFMAKIEGLRSRLLEQKKLGRKVFVVVGTGGTFQSGDTDHGRSPDGTLRESFDALGLPKDEKVHLELIDLMKLDSSQMIVDHWRFLAEMIMELENSASDAYDSVIVTHGTDTMARGASYLSFMLKGFPKSIIFTGSQEPARMTGSDAKDQMERAILTAKLATDTNRMIAEVMVCNGLRVARGTWATKLSDHSANVHGPWNQPSGQFDATDWHHALNQGNLHRLAPALLDFSTGKVTAKMEFAQHARELRQVGLFEPFTQLTTPADIIPIALTDKSPVHFARTIIGSRVNVLTQLGSATADDKLVMVALEAAQRGKAIYFASPFPDSQTHAGKYTAGARASESVDLVQRPLPAINLSPITHEVKASYLFHRLGIEPIDGGSGIGQIFSAEDLRSFYNGLDANLVGESV